MSSSNLLIGYGLLTLLVSIGGFQDWRTGEVSHWISLPLFGLGLLASISRVLFSADAAVAALCLFAIAVLTLAALNGWMGGADWKVLVGLFGLWPQAGFAALILSGVWGFFLMLRTGQRNARFPGVTVFAISAILTFIAELSIIAPN
jgi:hypothetical protein